MKRIALLSLLLASALVGLYSQQSGFVGTVLELKSNVIGFHEGGLPGCFKDGVLVHPSPADLKVGDVFIDVDGDAKQVSAVSKVGSDVYIDTVQPHIEDVFVYAKIPDQTIVFDERNFQPEALARSGGLVSLSDDTRGGSRGFFNASFETNIYKSKDEKTFVRVGGGVDLTATLGIGGELPHNHGLFCHHDGYVSGSMQYNLAISGSIAIVLEGSKESPAIPIVIFGTPTPGVEAGVGIYTKSVLEGSLSLTMPLTLSVSGDVGAGCTLVGMSIFAWPKDFTRTGTTDLTISLDPEVSAEGKATQKFYLGSIVKLFGIEVADFEAGGGIYVKLGGTVSGSVGYSIKDGLVEPDWDIDGGGEFGACIGVSGAVFEKKWSFSLIDNEFPFITFSAKEGWSSPFARSVGMGAAL